MHLKHEKDAFDDNISKSLKNVVGFALVAGVALGRGVLSVHRCATQEETAVTAHSRSHLCQIQNSSSQIPNTSVPKYHIHYPKYKIQHPEYYKARCILSVHTQGGLPACHIPDHTYIKHKIHLPNATSQIPRKVPTWYIPGHTHTHMSQ